MKKIPINLKVVASEELQRAIARELDDTDKDLDKILEDDEEEEDTPSSTE